MTSMSVEEFLAHHGVEGDTLAHYGVLGMKWGRRKDRSGTSRVSRKANDSDDFTASRATKKRKTRTLTNAEIKKANERFQLEKSYAQLKRDQAAITRGHNFMKAYLAIGTTAGGIYALSQTPLGKIVTKKGIDYINKIKNSGIL